jgi:hypothetical protein
MLDRNGYHLPAIAIAVWVGVGVNPSCQAQLGVALELSQQPLEVVWRQLGVHIELGDMGEGLPCNAVESEVEGFRSRCCSAKGSRLDE